MRKCHTWENNIYCSNLLKEANAFYEKNLLNPLLPKLWRQSEKNFKFCM